MQAVERVLDKRGYFGLVGIRTDVCKYGTGRQSVWVVCRGMYHEALSKTREGRSLRVTQ